MISNSRPALRSGMSLYVPPPYIGRYPPSGRWKLLRSFPGPPQYRSDFSRRTICPDRENDPSQSDRDVQTQAGRFSRLPPFCRPHQPCKYFPKPSNLPPSSHKRWRELPLRLQALIRIPAALPGLLPVPDPPRFVLPPPGYSFPQNEPPPRMRLLPPGTLRRPLPLLLH